MEKAGLEKADGQMEIKREGLVQRGYGKKDNSLRDIWKRKDWK